MNTATQRAKIKYSRLVLGLHKFRVVLDKTIIGQFSNVKLAAGVAHEYRGAVVWDISAKPPDVVYRDGKLLEKPE